MAFDRRTLARDAHGFNKDSQARWRLTGVGRVSVLEREVGETPRGPTQRYKPIPRRRALLRGMSYFTVNGSELLVMLFTVTVTS